MIPPGIYLSFFSLLLTLYLSSCAGVEQTKCSSDTNCPPEFFCNAGYCTKDVPDVGPTDSSTTGDSSHFDTGDGSETGDAQAEDTFEPTDTNPCSADCSPSEIKCFTANRYECVEISPECREWRLLPTNCPESYTGYCLGETLKCQSPELQIDQQSDSYQYYPFVAALDNGGFIVAWAAGNVLLEVSNDYYYKSFTETIATRTFGSLGEATGSEFRLNLPNGAYTMVLNSMPQLAKLSDNRFLLYWGAFENRNSDQYHYILGRLYEASGSPDPAGSIFQVNLYTEGKQYHPQVAVLSGGNFAAVWQSKKSSASGDKFAIFMRVYGPQGATLWGPAAVNSETAYILKNPSITPLSDNGFAVVWEHRISDADCDIKGKSFNADGTLRGEGAFLVNQYISGIQNAPYVKGLEGGRFFVAWQSKDQDGPGMGVYAAIFEANGARFGSEFPVNTYATGDQYIGKKSDKNIRDFRVIYQAPTLANSAIALPWNSLDQDSDDEGIYLRILDGQGNWASSEIQVNSTYTDSQRFPYIIPLPDQSMAVVWKTDSHSASYQGTMGVFGQYFTLSGAKLGSEFKINPTNRVSQEYVMGTPLKTGSFVVVWQSKILDLPEKYGIFARIYHIPSEDAL